MFFFFLFFPGPINRCYVYPKTSGGKVKLGSSEFVLCFRQGVNTCMQIIIRGCSGNRQSRQIQLGGETNTRMCQARNVY